VAPARRGLLLGFLFLNGFLNGFLWRLLPHVPPLWLRRPVFRLRGVGDAPRPIGDRSCFGGSFFGGSSFGGSFPLRRSLLGSRRLFRSFLLRRFVGGFSFLVALRFAPLYRRFLSSSSSCGLRFWGVLSRNLQIGRNISFIITIFAVFPALPSSGAVR